MRLALPRRLLVRLLRVASLLVAVAPILVGLLAALGPAMFGGAGASSSFEGLFVGISILVVYGSIGAVAALVLQALAQIVEDRGTPGGEASVTAGRRAID